MTIELLIQVGLHRKCRLIVGAVIVLLCSLLFVCCYVSFNEFTQHELSNEFGVKTQTQQSGCAA
jgi:hypothetical protein